MAATTAPPSMMESRPAAVAVRAAAATVACSGCGTAASTRMPAPSPTASLSACTCCGVAGTPASSSVIRPLTWWVKTAPSTATPPATPTWRSVLTAPVAIPARDASTLASAACEVAAWEAPRPTPAMTNPASSAVQCELPSSRPTSAIPIATRARLPPSMNRAGTRSANRAATGAATNAATVSGRNRRPPWSGLYPSVLMT